MIEEAETAGDLVLTESIIQSSRLSSLAAT